MKVGQIFWGLNLNSTGFQAGLAQASAQVTGFKSRLHAAEVGSKMLAKTMLVGSAAMAVGVGILAKKSYTAYNEQARRETELIQLHQKNTGATEEQTRSLFKLASQVQKNGVIGDEAIISGQAQLATFKLSTDAIKSLTPAMADMVAKTKGMNATGDDFVNIGNLTGKVMMGNVGALTRYGVTFDKAQEKILKTGNESERAATLAEVLAQNFGGVNKALLNTPEGRIKNLKNRIGDLQEGFGKLVAKGLQKVADWFAKVVTAIETAGGLMDWLKGIVERNRKPLAMLAGAIMVAMVPAFIAWGTAAFATAAGLWAIMAPLLPFIAVGAALGLLIDWIVKKTGGWGAMFERLKPIIENIKKTIITFAKAVKTYYDNWVAPAIKTVGALIGWLWTSVIAPIFKFIGGIIKWLIEKWNGLSDGVKKTIKTIAMVLGLIVVAMAAPILIVIAFISWLTKLWQSSETFRRIVTGIWNAVVTIVKWAWESIIKPVFDTIVWYITNVLVPTWKAIATVISWVWTNIVKPVWDLIWAYITNVLLPIFNKIWTVVKWVFEKVWAGIQAAWDFIQPIFQAVWDYITNTLVPIFKKIWETVSDVFTKVWTKVSDIFTKIKDGFIAVKTKITDFIDAVKGIKKSVTDALNGAKDWLVDIGKKIIEGLINGIKDGIKLIGDATGGIKDKVTGGVKKLFGINSPARIMIPLGSAVSAGFAVGMGDLEPVNKALQKMQMLPVNQLSRYSLPSNGFQLSDNPATASAGTTVVIEKVNLDGVWTSSRSDRRDLAKDFLDAVNDEFSSKGLPVLGDGKVSGSKG